MKLVKSLAIATTALMLSTPIVLAQATTDTDVSGHPRVNEVDQRLENQQGRIDNGVDKGQINARQEMRDQKRDAKISDKVSQDEAKHNGHLTKREQKRLNKKLNKNSTDIKDQRTDGK